MEYIRQVGIFVGDAILALASLLRENGSPGVVVIFLMMALLSAIIHLFVHIRRRQNAIGWLEGIICQTSGERDFSRRIIELDQKVAAGRRPGPRATMAIAWGEYRETLVPYDQDRETVYRNSVRPGAFFNLEDLHFGAGFWRILPGLFVTIGLFLTFLGLISALHTMGSEMSDTGEVSQGAMVGLLAVASAKFIMSLTGLFCSILFTIALRVGTGKVDGAVHRLNRAIEQRLSFISLEDLAAKQLAAIQEQREHFRSIGMELVAELGRPLREELPQAISRAVAAGITPLIDRVGQMSTDGLGDMVRDLSTRFSTDVGQALGLASNRLVEASDRIGALSGRLDQSSGRMGAEMEAAVARLGQAVDDLRGTMAASATATTGAFSQGAETLLAAIDTTLKGIRDNTEEGARAMSAAAANMQAAGEGIRVELEAAARQGAEAAQARMQVAGDEASNAIGHAGSRVITAFGNTTAEIARVTDEMAKRAGQDLVQPMTTIATKLEEMVAALSEGTVQVRHASDSARAGAEASAQAAGSFRGSAEALVQAAEPVRATVEGLGRSTRELAVSTGHIADSAQQSAKSLAQVLAGAQEALGGQRHAVEATLANLANALERMRGQGDRLDDLDEKLGKAFDAYTARVASTVDALIGHVREMQSTLRPALDTMRDIVEQIEQFKPQSKRS